MSWYDEFEPFDMTEIEHDSASGMDTFFQDVDYEKASFDKAASVGKKELPDRMKVSSVSQLDGFSRIASDTLVRVSEKDLWALEENEQGEFTIERLYDDDGNPLKA